MRYDAKTSLQTQGTSRHFIAFLAHEAFHYYMQNNWPAGGRFMEDLSKTDIDWMEKHDVIYKGWITPPKITS